MRLITTTIALLFLASSAYAQCVTKDTLNDTGITITYQDNAASHFFAVDGSVHEYLSEPADDYKGWFKIKFGLFTVEDGSFEKIKSPTKDTTIIAYGPLLNKAPTLSPTWRAEYVTSRIGENDTPFNNLTKESYKALEDATITIDGCTYKTLNITVQATGKNGKLNITDFAYFYDLGFSYVSSFGGEGDGPIRTYQILEIKPYQN